MTLPSPAIRLLKPTGACKMNRDDLELSLFVTSWLLGFCSALIVVFLCGSM